MRRSSIGKTCYCGLHLTHKARHWRRAFPIIGIVAKWQQFLKGVDFIKKRLFALFLVVCLLLVSSVAVFASSDEDEDDSGSILESIQNYLEDLFPRDFIDGGDVAVEIEERVETQDDISAAAEGTFKTISDFIGDDTAVSGFIPISQIAELLLTYFLPIGYMVFLLSWGIGMAKQYIQLDFVDGKGFVSLLVKLFGGWLVMSVSKEVLSLVDLLTASMSKELLANTSVMFTPNVLRDLWQTETSADGVQSITGWLNRTFAWLGGNYYLFIVYIALIIASASFLVTIAIRAVKLAIMQGVAPVFFGFAGGEGTIQYFKNFIIQYCLLSFKIVFIAVMYAALNMAMTYWALSVTSFQTGAWLPIMGIVILITIVTMINKSDEMFEKIFFGRGGL